MRIPSLKSHLNVSHFQECFSAASANSDEEALWPPRRMWPVFLSPHPRMQKCLQTCERRERERAGQRGGKKGRNKERASGREWGEAGTADEWKRRRSKASRSFGRVPGNICAKVAGKIRMLHICCQFCSREQSSGEFRIHPPLVCCSSRQTSHTSLSEGEDHARKRNGWREKTGDMHEEKGGIQVRLERCGDIK